MKISIHAIIIIIIIIIIFIFLKVQILTQVSLTAVNDSRCQRPTGRPTDQHTQLEPTVCAETRFVACHALSSNKYSPMFRQIVVQSKRQYLYINNRQGLTTHKTRTFNLVLLPSVLASRVPSF